jgi:Phosphoribosylformimino-5-aminoimidazole carboxamide ribonucleotide (ProFAR) isomerase
VALLVKLQQRFSTAEIIASGGIRSIADLQDLRTHGIQSAVIGKALAAGGMTLAELKAVN